MTIRVYLMPRIGDALTVQTARRPKYLDLLPAGSNAIYYGPEPYCMVLADVSAAQNTAVMANADVRVVPEDLDSTIVNAARVTITTTLEAASIPAQWIVNGMAYRVFVRRLAGIFFLTQNVSGRKFRLLQAALDDPLSALSANARAALQLSADTLGLSTVGITVATTLRETLTNFGNQFAGRPLVYRGVSL